MNRVLPLILALLVVLMLAVPLIATAGPTITDTYMPVMADKATPEPIYVNLGEEPAENDPGGIDLTELITAFVSVLVAIVTRYVVPWLKARTSAERLQQIEYWYQVAVLAAEKAYGAGHGAEKLADATEFLKAKGIIVDEKIIDALIQQFFTGTKKAAR